jgi:crossover junction endodeoxyribonuclease RuvC
MPYVIISIDPGLTGGIAIIDGRKRPKITRMPVVSVMRNKKKKNEYNLEKIVEICKEYIDKDVVCAVERQSVRPGEGNVSGFTTGVGYGSLKGIAVALGFKLLTIVPAVWKRHHKELDTELFLELRKEIKDIKQKSKVTKDKALKKQYKTDIARANRKLKYEAKKQSRLLCQKKYSRLKNELKLVKDDGKSDALLMGLYVRDNINELVPTNENEETEPILASNANKAAKKTKR